MPPRHPPDALRSLDRSHLQYPPCHATSRRVRHPTVNQRHILGGQILHPVSQSFLVERPVFIEINQLSSSTLPAVQAVGLRQRSKITRGFISQETCRCSPDVRPCLAYPFFTMSTYDPHYRANHPFNGAELDVFNMNVFGSASRPDGAAALPNNRVVEPDGIEPTTSCLQSTRSPS
jgi:hypothetical protein